ncbi:hypothetical protein [Mesorhizobium sp. WSM3873]|nr:hypothetical protein [Mesorhizobium sp. WSM3873]
MVDALRRDYANTTAMIFGKPPVSEHVMKSTRILDDAANRAA